MNKYIMSEAKSDNEITLKDRVNELGDKFAYIEQSIYLLENFPEKVNDIIDTLNGYLDECMSKSAVSVKESYNYTNVNSATNTANIAAKPSCDIFCDDDCVKSFLEMVRDGDLSIAITEPDEEYDEYAINTSEIPENLRDAAAKVYDAENDLVEADAILYWLVDTDYTAEDVNQLQAEVERYFKAYKSLMDCADETLTLALWVAKDLADTDESAEIRLLDI